jgi:hypothetical protein
MRKALYAITGAGLTACVYKAPPSTVSVNAEAPRLPVPDLRGYSLPVVSLGVQSMLVNGDDSTEKVCVFDPNWSDEEKHRRIGTFDVGYVHGEIVTSSEFVGLARDYAVATSRFGTTAVETWKRCAVYETDCDDIGFSIRHSFPLSPVSDRPVSMVDMGCTAAEPCFEMDPSDVAGLRAVSATVHDLFDVDEMSSLPVKASGEIYVEGSYEGGEPKVMGGVRIKF